MIKKSSTIRLSISISLFYTKIKMNKKLSLIFRTDGSASLNILDENFSNDQILEEFIDSCFFDQVNFTDCFFDESELVGVNFNFCSFNGCTFKNTVIRKSEFTNCQFKNCQFLDSVFSPKVDFFRTLFMNCQFSTVNFSFAFLYECEFLEINLTKVQLKGTSFVDPKIRKISYNSLELDESQPIRIKITKNDIFRILE